LKSLFGISKIGSQNQNKVLLQIFLQEMALTAAFPPRHFSDLFSRKLVSACGVWFIFSKLNAKVKCFFKIS